VPRKVRILTKNEAEEVRIDIRDGVDFAAIAKEWRISTHAVSDINGGHTYKIRGFTYPIVQRVKKKEYNGRS
jgi:hypothetical protein